MNKFLKEFKDRGYFYQCTSEDELSNLLDKKSINSYIGFDSTASSLHVGSLLQIMCLRLLQKHGHRPIVLLGGGTTRIGDPSGKEETRKILSEKEIENSEWSGQGVLTFPNGATYEGEWANGFMNGKGTFTWSDGKEKTGTWVNGELQE